MQFLLGTHEVSWLERLDVPLFVSHRRLAGRKRLPLACAGWALDSGGFSELSLYGRWKTSVESYCEAVERYGTEIGRLMWAAPMDWMCEPFMVEKTGLSVREHQERTVSNYLELANCGPFIPVLQGWTVEDYDRCVDMYLDAGIRLHKHRLVGVGSVCRRQDTAETARIFERLWMRGINCHGFGVKKEGVARYRRLLASADSMAWSYRARRDPPLPGCTHRSCANCPRFALRWRDELLAHTNQLSFETCKPRMEAAP